MILVLTLLACARTPTAPGAAAHADTASDTGALPDPGPDHWASDRPLNIAHRGGKVLGPEETIGTFALALAAGADVLECDVHSTSDGALICMHDDTVDRTTDGSGDVHDFTLEQLKALDAGYTWTADDGSTPFRGIGEQVATLDEALAAYPDPLWSVEIKQLSPSIALDVVATLQAHDRVARTVLSTSHDGVMGDARAAAPDLPTALTVSEMIAFVNDSQDDDYTPAARFIQAPVAFSGVQVVTAESVAIAHAHGQMVHPWTINDPDEMRALLAIGVDGVFSDDTPALEAALDELNAE